MRCSSIGICVAEGDRGRLERAADIVIEADEQGAMKAQVTRRIGPVRAFLAGFFGLGLGYVYVGDLRLALASIFGTLGILALLSWTRLIMVSALAYWICAGIVSAVTLAALIH